MQNTYKMFSFPGILMLEVALLISFPVLISAGN